MLEIGIPGYRTLRLEHLVLDYNGTIAADGRLIDGAAGRLRALSGLLHLHVLTADTFGTARTQLASLPCDVHVLPETAQDAGKREYVEALGAQRVVSVGNGRNDRFMIEAAALGIVVVQTEGASGATLAAADVVAASILDALDLLLQPQRLVATLRA